MSSITFDKLEQEYNRFRDPCCKIKIEGTELPENLTVHDVTADLTYGHMAASGSFTVENAFQRAGKESVELKNDVDGLIQPGNRAEIYLGYGKKLRLVFFGYIDGISLDFKEDGSGLRYTVECLDAKGIMMNSFRSEPKIGVTRYSDAVSDTCKKYPGLIKKKVIDSTQEVKSPIEQHKESDYEFIVRLADKINYAFYLINGTLYFQKKHSDREELIGFRLNEYLQEFHLHTTLYRQVSKVTVRNGNESDPGQPIEAAVDSYTDSVDGTKRSAGENKLLNRNITATFASPSAASEKEAREAAQAVMDERFEGRVSGTAVLVGVPELIPGKLCSVSGFGKAYDRKYRIKRVLHRLTADGYTTECELEGNRL